MESRDAVAAPSMNRIPLVMYDVLPLPRAFLILSSRIF